MIVSENEDRTAQLLRAQVREIGARLVVKCWEHDPPRFSRVRVNQTDRVEQFEMSGSGVAMIQKGPGGVCFERPTRTERSTLAGRSDTAIIGPSSFFFGMK